MKWLLGEVEVTPAEVAYHSKASPVSSSSPKNTALSRAELEIEFVSAYMEKGDEALNDDRFRGFRPTAQKKKLKTYNLFN